MYKLNKKIEPYVSGEFIQLIDAHNYPLDETRFSFGLTYELPRKNSMKIFYTLKNEDKTKKNPDEIGVFGLSYNFSL